MAFNLPPVVKLAERLAADIEEAVTRFARRHRYTFGTRLRDSAWAVLKTADAAARRPAERPQLLQALRDAMDELKAVMQLGQRLRQFASFGQFEALMRTAHDLGRQIGAWHRQFHPQGQNAAAQAPRQRAKTLSTHAASMCEANP
jgi:hypothetical protein